MKIKKSALLYILMLTTMLFSSCATASSASPQAQPTPMMAPSATATTTPDSCIQPPVNLALPVGPYAVAEIKTPYIPPLGWETVVTAPESISHYINNFVVVDGNIWGSYITGGHGDKVARYDLDKKEWLFYSSTKNEQNRQMQLFLSRNGVVWEIFTRYLSNDENQPILARYDPQTDQFEAVVDTQNILQTPTEFFSDKVVEDSNGLLWMFLGSWDSDLISLYSFDPSTLQMEKHPVNIPRQTAKVSVGTNEGIWILDRETGELLEYFPSSHELHTLDHLNRTSPDDKDVLLSDVLKEAGFVYQDRSGRVWLGNQGWLDFADPAKPAWYQLIPSLVFVTYRQPPSTYVVTSRVFDIFQSSNGWLWFSTDAGIARLEIKKGYEQGEWCLVTNGAGDILQDDENNLWMKVYDTIYKYHLP